MTPFSPRARAADYSRLQLPRVGVVVPSPWWWAVLGLDCGVINIGETVEVEIGVAVAIIGAFTPPLENLADQRAIVTILAAEGRAGFDAYTMPWSPNRVADRLLGIAKVAGVMGDADARGLWFDGPVALRTAEPLLFASPLPLRTRLAANRQCVALDQDDRDTIYNALIDRAARP